MLCYVNHLAYKTPSTGHHCLLPWAPAAPGAFYARLELCRRTWSPLRCAWAVYSYAYSTWSLLCTPRVVYTRIEPSMLRLLPWSLLRTHGAVYARIELSMLHLEPPNNWTKTVGY